MKGLALEGKTYSAVLVVGWGRRRERETGEGDEKEKQMRA